MLLPPPFPENIPCRTNPDMWTDPTSPAEAEEAKRLCVTRCPARAQCEAWAAKFTPSSREGEVWAGQYRKRSAAQEHNKELWDLIAQVSKVHGIPSREVRARFGQSKTLLRRALEAAA